MLTISVFFSISYANTGDSKTPFMVCLTPAYLGELTSALVSEVETNQHGPGSKSDAMLRGPCGSLKEGLYIENLGVVTNINQQDVVELRVWGLRREHSTWFTYRKWLEGFGNSYTK